MFGEKKSKLEKFEYIKANADALAMIHYNTKHIHAIESGMFDRIRALELRIQELEARP